MSLGTHEHCDECGEVTAHVDGLCHKCMRRELAAFKRKNFERRLDYIFIELWKLNQRANK